jgi:peptidoglycan hydrolase-like protein with peptidoglycan-binding domain
MPKDNNWFRRWFGGRPRAHSSSSGDQLYLFTKRPILHMDSTPKSLEDAIVELQTELEKRGLLSYPNARPNGRFDEITKEAVKTFQLEHRLQADGIVGPLTWACLYHPMIYCSDPNITQEKHKAIKELQSILRLEKFPIREDGRFGKQTERAVKHFQRIYGLKSDGVVGAWTWTVLLGVRQKTEDALPDGLYILLYQGWFAWEHLFTVTFTLLGIYWNPLNAPSTDKDPLSFPALLVTAYALTCVTAFLMELPLMKQFNQSNQKLLRYAPFAPYVLTGIFWQPLLAMLKEAINHLSTQTHW